MLILRRRAGEALYIGNDIKITVLSSEDGGVRLAIDAPKEIAILRSELMVAMDVNKDSANEQACPQDLLAILGSMGMPPQAQNETK